MHHAVVIEGEGAVGVKAALGYAERELGVAAPGNPDVILREYGLLSVEDARELGGVAMQAPLAGDKKVLIISASRMYHEAQNALLKLFEEPPAGTYLFLILPSAGTLLPTLRSRVQVLDVRRPTSDVGRRTSYIPDEAEEFVKASREKRSAIIKKLASGRDEDERRENRDRALAIVNGIEGALLRQGFEEHAATLREIQALRGYMHDRSAPVKMILEHLSLVLPAGLRDKV